MLDSMQSGVLALAIDQGLLAICHQGFGYILKGSYYKPLQYEHVQDISNDISP